MQRLQHVLSQQPRVMVFDIDGTLSPIAPTPDAARLFPGIAPLLEQARQHAHVVIMTGRGIDDGAAMVNIEGLTYIGSHGLEWSDGLPSTHPVQIEPEALAFQQAGTHLLDLAQQKLATIDGILVERKRIGGAVHYRLCAQPEQARQQIFALLSEPAQQVNMRLSEGKRVVEIKTPLKVNKGVALQRIAHHFSARGLLFAGDDRTDLDAILEIARLRENGLPGISIVVQHHDTLPELLEHADIVVQEVEGMAELLTKIVQLL